MVVLRPKPWITKPPLASLNMAVPRAAALIGYWAFLEGAGRESQDLVSNGARNRGVNNTGTAPYWKNGIFGPCHYASTVGSGSFLRIATKSELNPAVFTAECWVKLESTPSGGDGAAFSKLQSTGWIILCGNGSNVIKFAGNPGSDLSGPALTLGLWYHICCTYDGSTKKIYVNGQQYASGSGTITQDTGQDLNIGTYQSSSLCWPGFVDLCAYYNRPLTAEEVWDAYNNPLALLAPARGLSVVPAVGGGGGGVSGSHLGRIINLAVRTH